MKKAMELLDNERGAITPSFVLMVMLMMLCGAYFFSLMKVYENRLIVRDAVDAAVTSALAAGAETRQKSTLYYEELVCVRSHTEHDEETGESYTVCDEWAWVPRQGRVRKYVAIRPGAAEAAARRYLALNLEGNTRDVTVKDFQITVTYDAGRPLTVESERRNTETPDSWWQAEFGDSDPPPLTAVSTRMVRFPRWARAEATAVVEVRIPLGRLLGQDTIQFTWHGEAVKELKETED